MLFDFIVTELARREPEDERRIRPVRIALQNQRDDLLAFAGVLDDQLIAVARAQELSVSLVREACVLHRLPTTSAAYWQGWNQLRTKLGSKFCALFDAVTRVMAQTTAQQFAGGESQFPTAQLLHAAPSLGWIVFGPATILLEPPSFHTQSTRGANRTQPAGIIDRRKPSALVDVVGPRRASTPASVIRGGRPASRTRQPADRNPASKPGRSDASVSPKNRRF
jgi:hypothetical protein